MESKKSPCGVKVGKLVKIKSNKKRNLFEELSFVEDHVNTFYNGLNDCNAIKGANNPITAKVVDLEDDMANLLVKDWVQPDSQLVKMHKLNGLTIKKTPINQGSISRKYKPLEFKEVPLESQTKKPISRNILDDMKANFLLPSSIQTESSIQIESLEMNKSSPAKTFIKRNKSEGILKKIFDDANSTYANDYEKITQVASEMAPKRYRVFVDDTPVDYYGLPVFERRLLGLKN